jgi:hypothetical protein
MTTTPGRYDALIRDWCNRTGKKRIPATMTTAEIMDAFGVTAKRVSYWRTAIGMPHDKTNRRGKNTYAHKTAEVIDWATKHQPLPVPTVKAKAVPLPEWGWRQDQKINCVTEKQ